MRIVGIRRDGGAVEVAALSDDGAHMTVVAGLEEFWADAAGALSRDPSGPTVAVAEVEQVPPVLPDARVICIGLNYLKHVAEGTFREAELPEHPTLFARWTQSLTVGGAEVPVPSTEDGLDWEGEVMAYVGRTLVDAGPDEALAAVVGYSTFNDLTSRRAQRLTSQWILGKNGDRSGPLGPMVPAAEVGDLRDGLRVRTRVNGEVVQDASTDEMVYPVGDTLSLISHTLTLRPGDLLATGTPSGVGYARTPPWLLQPGDVVEVEVERLGVLRNPIAGNDAQEGLTVSGEFRQYLFAHEHPRYAEVRGLDAYAYREHARQPGTFTGGLVEGWTPLYLAEFRGVTEDGSLREDLHDLTPAEPGEEAPVAAMVAAARDLLAALDDDGRSRIAHPVDAPEWQTWANPEFMQFDTGLRLEFQPAVVRDRALALVRASLSPEGFELAHAMMLINGFLGEVVDLPTVLGRWSYNIALYGEPDLRAPWGWQLFGHHCALNCLVVEGRMVLSPVFLGAEPDEIDEGPHAGLAGVFDDRIRLGTAIMAALPDDLRRSATVYQQLVDPAMPPGRVHPGDERHLAGAFQDNRVIPVEGIRVAGMPAAAQELVFAAAEEFVRLLPVGPRAARMREIRERLDETWFSWIGGSEPGDVFYYRIQSPVVIAELDHHCGVFLDYDTPKPFHVHTVLRTPHGNDYGRTWVRQWQERRSPA